MKRLRTSFLFGAGLLFALACARQYGQPLATSHMNTKPSSDGGVDASKGDGILTQLFGLKDKAIGPFLARSESGGVIAYVGSALEDKTRPIVVLAVTADGQAKGEAHVVAHAPTDTNALLLRKLGGPKPVYVAAWSALPDRGEGLPALPSLDSPGGPVPGRDLGRFRTRALHSGYSRSFVEPRWQDLLYRLWRHWPVEHSTGFHLEGFLATPARSRLKVLALD